MSDPDRRASDAGRLRVWVVVLALAFVAVALQQSHRYHRLREDDPMESPLDARTAYRNGVHAFEFYCESAATPEPRCEVAREFLRAVSRRHCEPARTALESLLGAAPDRRATTHPLDPPFRALYEQVCPQQLAP